jgi:hypothetical protein
MEEIAYKYDCVKATHDNYLKYTLNDSIAYNDEYTFCIGINSKGQDQHLGYVLHKSNSAKPVAVSAWPRYAGPSPLSIESVKLFAEMIATTL